MYGTLDISTSALIAQRTRLTVIADNIANARTILNAEGEYEPFRCRIVRMGAGDPAKGSDEGVHIAAIELDEGPLAKRFEPTSPYADADGYVGYPNVNVVTQRINAMEAMRAYEANISVIEATKSMTSVALEMIS